MWRALSFLVAAFLAGPALAAAGPYGAIAYAEADDNVYVVTDKNTQDEAVAAAMEECQKENESCAVPLWFMNSCGAFSSATNGSWGTGWGDTQDLATTYAIKTCSDEGGKDCKLRIVMCSPGGAGYIPN